MEGKHLGLLTLEASGERPGLSGIADCGWEGRKESRQAGGKAAEHMVTVS